ncbi:MAG TPA: bifunctional UDP-sugar hydrolase/5'-nucleotidase [Bacillota bacterium]|nr:bifunctional UDP-sugar hydrolase/5'-nucleotidase [Bacillota bacterium]HPJ86009.1 bifunctional UDP-sugar hydrolase/5'-nucleotidase [Bacillota bacterium]
MNDEMEFCLLFTSDVHGHLYPIDYVTEKKASNSLANIASVIRKHRIANTVVLDLGDILQGSPMMDYHWHKARNKANPAAFCLKGIGYDYFVPGNHDFNYGRAYLSRFISQITAKPLCANILTKKGNPAIGSPYDIVELTEGLKIAIIAVTTQYIPNWEKKANVRGLVFTDACLQAKKLVERIRKEEDPTMVIVAYHGGFEKDLDTFLPYVDDTGENEGSRMLETIEGIDVLLTGHQHRKICQKVKNTWVIQPMSNALAVGKVITKFAKNGDKWGITGIDAEIMESTGYPENVEICKRLEKEQIATEEYLDKVIGIAPKNDMEIKDQFDARLHKHKVVTFINRVQLDKSKAMITCSSLGNSVTGFKKMITVRDVYTTYLYPNNLVVVEITGEKLRLALEKCAEYFVVENGRISSNPKYSHPKVEHYNYDMFDGIDYTIDISKPEGSRIVRLERNGVPVRENDILTLAMNNYRYAGGGEFAMYKGLKTLRSYGDDITDLITKSIEKKHLIVVDDPKNIVVKASKNQ